MVTIGLRRRAVKFPSTILRQELAQLLLGSS
jgi:hypothetical protein